MGTKGLLGKRGIIVEIPAGNTLAHCVRKNSFENERKRMLYILGSIWCCFDAVESEVGFAFTLRLW